MARDKSEQSRTESQPERSGPIKPMPFPGESPTVALAMAAAQQYGLHEEDEKPKRAEAKPRAAVKKKPAKAQPKRAAAKKKPASAAKAKKPAKVAKAGSRGKKATPARKSRA